MTDTRVEDLNIESNTVLVSPDALKAEMPISEKAAAAVMQGRSVVRDILDRKDPRLFVVVGPCSIHDTEAAIEYGKKLVELQEKVKDSTIK